MLKFPGHKGLPSVVNVPGQFRVDKLANRQQYERMLKALFVCCAPERSTGDSLKEMRGKKSKKPSQAVLGTVLWVLQ